MAVAQARLIPPASMPVDGRGAAQAAASRFGPNCRRTSEALYAGSAPAFVSGLMELHVRVPGTASTGGCRAHRAYCWKREQPARPGRVGEVGREYGHSHLLHSISES